jgi:hypothetical protein
MTGIDAVRTWVDGFFQLDSTVDSASGLLLSV